MSSNHTYRAGKSIAARKAVEFALNSGKTVYVCTPAGATKQKRIKHLTLIEPVDLGKKASAVIFDEYSQCGDGDQ